MAHHILCHFVYRGAETIHVNISKTAEAKNQTFGIAYIGPLWHHNRVIKLACTCASLTPTLQCSSSLCPSLFNSLTRNIKRHLLYFSLHIYYLSLSYLVSTNSNIAGAGACLHRHGLHFHRFQYQNWSLSNVGTGYYGYNCQLFTSGLLPARRQISIKLKTYVYFFNTMYTT